jgi:hypothetical protein
MYPASRRAERWEEIMSILCYLSRLCSPRCWMATHDPAKCELWTGLVGPCHIIAGPSGSRATVQCNSNYQLTVYCRICCVMALQWVGCLGLAISATAQILLLSLQSPAFSCVGSIYGYTTMAGSRKSSCVT